MNSNLKRMVTVGAVAVTLMAGTQTANAGAGQWLQPRTIYELKISAAPETNVPLVVALLDEYGRVVKDAQVVLMRPVFHRDGKWVHGTAYMPEALEQQSDGTFVCPGEHHVSGEVLTLRGTGPDDTSPVWLSVTVKN